VFEKPRLDIREGSVNIQVAAEQADRLLADLREAGFHGELTEGDFGTEDLNTGVKEHVAVIELADGTDQASLRKILRGWSAGPDASADRPRE
jgi:hypothetical protein